MHNVLQPLHNSLFLGDNTLRYCRINKSRFWRFISLTPRWHFLLRLQYECDISESWESGELTLYQNGKLKGYVEKCYVCMWWYCLKNWTSFVWLLRQLVFDLAKQGMMRKFSGSWKFEPMKASESGDLGHGERRAPDHDDPVVGSWVSFQQVVEPAVKPPWPLNNYIRGIAEKIVREMLGDLQRECQRLSDVQNNTTSASKNVAQQSWLCFPTPIFINWVDLTFVVVALLEVRASPGAEDCVRRRKERTWTLMNLSATWI